MLRTIIIGSCVSIQGVFVRNLPNGKIAVCLDSTIYEGYPVCAIAA